MRSTFYLIFSACLVFGQEQGPQDHFILYDRDFKPAAPVLGSRNNIPVQATNPPDPEHPSYFRGIRYPRDTSLSVYALGKELAKDALGTVAGMLPILQLPVLNSPSRPNVMLSEIPVGKTTGYMFATPDAGTLTLDGYSFACAKYELGISIPLECDMTVFGIDNNGLNNGRKKTRTYLGTNDFAVVDTAFTEITGIYFKLNEVYPPDAVKAAFPNGIGNISVYIDNLRYRTQNVVA